MYSAPQGLVALRWMEAEHRGPGEQARWCPISGLEAGAAARGWEGLCGAEAPALEWGLRSSASHPPVNFPLGL